jgi:hypothetical protein
MREITKSFFSFSWAMSLFGIQQTTNLMSPEKMSKAFGSVTEATEEQFSDALKTTFNAGDKLQRSAVDLTLGICSGEELNPNKWLRVASNTAKKSVEAVTQTVQEVTATVRQTATTEAAQGAEAGKESATGSAGTPTDSQRHGWGTMPS